MVKHAKHKFKAAGLADPEPYMGLTGKVSRDTLVIAGSPRAPGTVLCGDFTASKMPNGLWEVAFWLLVTVEPDQLWDSTAVIPDNHEPIAVYPRVNLAPILNLGL